MTAPAQKTPAKTVDEFDPKRTIRAVYGDMIDPTDNRTITQKWERLGEVTNWIKVQVKAGKLELEPLEA